MTKNIINYQSIYSQQIYLDSANAQIQLNGSKKSNCTFFFSDILKFDKNNIEMRLELVNAQVPISWYLINSTNNQFSTSTNGETTFQIWTLPVGNYNATTFITMFQTYMGSAFTVSFSSITNTFTFTYGYGAWTLTDIGCNSIFSIIGFGSGIKYHSTGTPIATIQAPFSVAFGGLSKVNIKTSTFNLSNSDSYAKGNVQTICSLPVSSIQGGYIFYNNMTNFKSIFRNHELSSINIQIQDPQNNYIDFNNVDWTITLQIDIVKEIIQSVDNMEDVYNNLTPEL